MWLHQLTIAVYAYAQAHRGHEETRKRKLLLHSHEIERLRARVEPEHLSLIPLSVYFKDGRAKVELAVAQRPQDPRQAPGHRRAGRQHGRPPRDGPSRSGLSPGSIARPRATGRSLTCMTHTRG